MEITLFLSIVGYSLFQCHWSDWRLRTHYNSCSASTADPDWVQTTFFRESDISDPWRSFFFEYHQELLLKSTSVRAFLYWLHGRDTTEAQIIEDLTVNEHYRLMRVIHGRINLDPLYTGLSQFFQNIVDSQLTYLPNSVNMIPFNQEVCILLWRFMTINQHVFEDFTMRDDFHSKILLGILILLDSSKKNPTKSNLMYLTIFMLLTISSSRELSMNLN